MYSPSEDIFIMQGHQEYQPELFSSINIEDLIPKNHLLRKLDKILDLSFIRSETLHLYCTDNGRPSVDPELFIRMLLISYFYGVSSDRRLCEEVSLNIAYRWFCKLSLKDKVPDHSSLSKIRDRLGEDTFKKIFDEVLNLCVKHKLVKREDVKVMIDASMLKADAALNSLVRIEADEEEIKNRPSFVKGQKYSNKTHISCSDPDASLANKVGSPKALYYKVHTSIDSDQRVILDTFVTSGNVPDGNVFQDQILRLVDEGLNITEVTADRGYGFGDNLEFLEETNIDNYVPRFHETVSEHLSDKFEFDEKNDRFKCPMNEWLYPYKSSRGDRANIKYRIKNKCCKTCSIKSSCLPQNAKIERPKSINVSGYHRIQKETLLREQDPIFKQRLSERMWKIEGIFAEAKNFHNMKKAKYRGQAKVQIQLYMTAMVQNLKRVMNRVPNLINHVLRKIFWKNNFYQNFSLKIVIL